MTAQHLEIEDQERWVEVPKEYLYITLESIAPMEQVITMMIEIQNKDKSWPRAKGADWRETLQTGDIVDVQYMEGWHETLIRYVYPKNSDKGGICIIHCIGDEEEDDEELDIKNSVEIMAKRHTHTKDRLVVR